MMDIIDLYAGYEGEPEIVFQVIKNEKVVKTLNVWDGHLLFIVENSLKTELGWKAERTVEETLASAWAWEKYVRGIE
mgnify:CR=1 FL=1